MNQKLIYNLMNAAIVGGIVFLSSLLMQYPPTPQVLYQAVIGAGLALLTQTKSIIEGLIEGNNGRNSGSNEEIYGIPVVKTDQQDKKLKLGMLI